MKRLKISSALAAITFAMTAVSAHASGVLVAAGDEWLLTNTAYSAPYVGGTTAFVKSLSATFGGSNYLLLTGDVATGGEGGLTSFASQLQNLGKTVSYSATLPASLASYDAVFHIGQGLSSTADLDAYVSGGGNLYISLGGGDYGTAAAEASFWNPFLANYGLTAGSQWFSSTSLVDASVTSGPPGVTNILWGYGQSIEAIPATNGISYVRGSFAGGPQNIGLIGTSIPLISSPPVPEPATWLMLVAGFAITGSVLRRRPVKRCVA